MADRLSLTVLGGFLGAGKTTWARHQLRQGAFGKAHVIVNEAAEAAIDDLLLGPVSLIAGGCACCAALPRLIAVLRDLCDQRSRGEGPVRVLLETSGLADPAAIARGIAADPVLSRHLRLVETIVTVDALHGAAQLRADALARAQVASADRLVVTKPAGAPDVAGLLGLLQVLNPGAQVEGAEQGLGHPLPPASPPPDLGLDDGPAPRLAVVRLPQGLEWTGFALWLSALLHARGDRILRAKGVIPAPSGRLLLQAVRSVVQPPEILPGPALPGDGTLILFGPDLDACALQRSLQRVCPDPEGLGLNR